MNRYASERNKRLAERTINALRSRNMSGYYAATREEALEIALSLIPEKSRVAMGGGMSVHEIGLSTALTEGNFDFVNRAAAEDKDAATEFCMHADVFLSSVNAMTEDGVLVNIDANGNRIAAIILGPKKVVLIVGMNKICRDLDAAMKRARSVAAPINAQRFDISTPCRSAGTCMDCKSPDTICCQFLITRFSHHKDRIHVILVNDSLGF